MSILNGEADAGKEMFDLPVMIKADVQGSEQALSTALRFGPNGFGVGWARLGWVGLTQAFVVWLPVGALCPDRTTIGSSSFKIG